MKRADIGSALFLLYKFCKSARAKRVDGDDGKFSNLLSQIKVNKAIM
jgi:hypothetical protein